MKTSVLLMAVIHDGDRILMRKKPDGSPPYSETWYIFGTEINGTTHDTEIALKDAVRAQTGVEISLRGRSSWDIEIKNDHDGVQTFFVYLDALCDYAGGALVPGPGIERLSWIPIAELKDYDIVPPSVKLFRKLGYL